MNVADAGGANEAGPACASPDAEPAATRIVSNSPSYLRVSLRGSPALQTNLCDMDDESGSWETASDEDDDEDENLGTDELADDIAVLEEELQEELGAWDPIAPAGFPHHMHGVSSLYLTPLKLHIGSVVGVRLYCQISLQGHGMLKHGIHSPCQPEQHCRCFEHVNIKS